MKIPLFGKFLLVGLFFAASSVLAADSNSKDIVEAAIRKLAQQPSYSWKSTATAPESGTNQPSTRSNITEGKTEKGGYTALTMVRGESTTEAVLKNGKGAIKTVDGWKSLGEASKGNRESPTPANLLSMMLLSYQLPPTQMLDLAEKTKELKLTNGVYAGPLTDAGARQMLSFRRAGVGTGGGPAAHDARGFVRFWINDGILSKCEFRLQGGLSAEGVDKTIDRTTIVEIKDVGTTKISVPEEATKKASQ